MGVDFTLATDRCHVLDDPWKDHAVPIRFEEPEESALLLTNLADKPDGLVAVADRSTSVASLTAEQLGIPWHPPNAVALCRNKNRMRATFIEAGLKVPITSLYPRHRALARRLPALSFPAFSNPWASPRAGA